MNNFLRYNAPAKSFRESFVLGNGHIGASIYGGVKNEKILLNEVTFYSGFPREYEHIPQIDFNKLSHLVKDGKIIEAETLYYKNFAYKNTQRYLPFAWLQIENDVKKESEYSRVLDMESAVASIKASGENYQIEREYFVSYPAGVMAYNVQQNGVKKTVISIGSLIKNNVKSTENSLEICGVAPAYADEQINNKDVNGYYYSDDDAKKGMKFCGIITAKSNGETVYKDGKIEIINATEYTVYLSLATSFNGYNKHPYLCGNENYYKNCKERVQAAQNKGYQSLKKEHTEDFKSLYNKTYFSITEEDKKPSDQILKNKDISAYEILFNFGKFLTISASRSDSTVMNLQGLWNEFIAPPWGSNYTININTQMNYFATVRVGLASCFTPYINFVKSLAQNGKKTAKEMYNVSGIVSHHNSDIWCTAWPVGYFSNTCPRWSFFNASFGWLLNEIYDYYLFTGDKAFLKDILYPLVKGCVEFFNNMLLEVDGKLALCPASSPENAFILDGESHSFATHSAMNDAIVREAFKIAIECAKALGDTENQAKYQNVYKKIMPYKIATDGRIMEWDKEREEEDVNHRHISHLYGLHPGHEISPIDTPALAKACKKSLNIRGDGGTGWCIAWKANTWARLFDGNRALDLIDSQLNFVEPVADTGKPDYNGRGGTFPNFLCAHPPFQIDGNMGAMSAFTEMVMQCRIKEDIPNIYLLPALPDKFKQGEVKGLCAFGGFIVDTVWKNGKATSVITATRDSYIKINANIKSITVNGKAVKENFIKAKKGDVIKAEFKF